MDIIKKEIKESSFLKQNWEKLKFLIEKAVIVMGFATAIFLSFMLLYISTK